MVAYKSSPLRQCPDVKKLDLLRLSVDHGIIRRLSLHQTSIHKNLAAIDQARLHTLPHDTFKEALKHLHSPPLPRLSSTLSIHDELNRQKLWKIHRAGGFWDIT